MFSASYSRFLFLSTEYHHKFLFENSLGDKELLNKE